MTLFTTVLAAALAAYPALLVVRAALVGRRGGLRDRVGAASAVASSLFAVVLLRLFVPWQQVPPLLWGLPVAATVLGALAAAGSWRALVPAAGPRPKLRLVSSVAGTAVVLALVAYLLVQPLLRG